MSEFLFHFFSLMLIFSGIGVVMSSNPVRSVLCLVLSFINAAGIAILLGAEYIGMMLVIVYAGAVAILLLFIVMMLNVEFERRKIISGKNLIRFLAIIVCTSLQIYAGFGQIRVSIHPFSMVNLYQIGYDNGTERNFATFLHNNAKNQDDNSFKIGEVLYIKYSLHLQLAGVILLVAIIGALFLAFIDEYTSLDRRLQNYKRVKEASPEALITFVDPKKETGYLIKKVKN